MKISFKICSAVLMALLISVTCAVAQDSQGEIAAPKAISFPNPEYPPEARAAGFGGTVRVQVTVDKNGKVKVEDALGPNGPCASLDDPKLAAIRKAAVEAAEKAIFEPPMKDGKPTEIGLLLSYDFNPTGSVPPKPPQDTKPINAGLINGKALRLLKPRYPPGAGYNRISGIVQVGILVDITGKVVSAGAISGHPALRRVSVEAACGSKFSPTKLKGVLVEVTGIVTYTFIAP